jgi:hypothetical protein
MKTCLKYLALVAALTVGLSISAIAGNGSNNYKLGGAWVAKVIESPLPAQWSYVVVADPSGKHASGHGSIDIGFRTEAVLGGTYFDPTDSSTPILVNVVKTGPDTATFHSVWYGLKDLPSLSVPIRFMPRTISNSTTHGRTSMETGSPTRTNLRPLLFS